MTTLEKQIYEIISKANGIKGSDIANALQLDKRTVNSTLSQSHALKAVVKQESDYKWYKYWLSQKSGTWYFEC